MNNGFEGFTDPDYDKQKTLYRSDAIERSKYVSDVQYELALAMLRGGQTFFGQVSIVFTLKDGFNDSKSIFIDYKGKKVLSLIINGQKVESGDPFRDHKIYMPLDLLKVGENQVTCSFESKYVQDC